MWLALVLWCLPHVHFFGLGLYVRLLLNPSSIHLFVHPSTYRFIHLSILCPFHIYPFIGLCLSQRSPVICGVMRLRLSLFFFLLYLFIIFGLGLPAYICNHNPFLRESVYKFIHQWDIDPHRYISINPHIYSQIHPSIQSYIHCATFLFHRSLEYNHHNFLHFDTFSI